MPFALEAISSACWPSFLRVHPNRSMLDWLSTFAAHAAVAIGNCRAFQQIDQLRRQMELERDYLRQEVIETGDFHDIIGGSPALRHVLRHIELVAQTDSSVLIQGETGTGKELIARPSTSGASGRTSR